MQFAIIEDYEKPANIYAKKLEQMNLGIFFNDINNYQNYWLEIVSWLANYYIGCGNDSVLILLINAGSNL